MILSNNETKNKKGMNRVCCVFVLVSCLFFCCACLYKHKTNICFVLVQTHNEKYRTVLPEVKCECVSVWCVGTGVCVCVCVCARARWRYRIDTPETPVASLHRGSLHWKHLQKQKTSDKGQHARAATLLSAIQTQVCELP